MNPTLASITLEPKKTSLLSFSENIAIIVEPKNLAEDLRLARKSDCLQRKADKARMERLLAPILTITHRRNIYIRKYMAK